MSKFFIVPFIVPISCAIANLFLNYIIINYPQIKKYDFILLSLTWMKLYWLGVKNYFPGVTVNDRINPDEVVAYGATMEAAKLMDKDEQILDKVILKDVTPLTLGMIT